MADIFKDTKITPWPSDSLLKHYESISAKESNTASDGISHSAWNKPLNFDASAGFTGSNPISSLLAAASALKYPIDMDTNQDHIEIAGYKYQRPNTGGQGPNPFGRMNASAGATPGKSSGGSVAAGSPKCTILLPMPKVSDSAGAEWGESSMNMFTMWAAQTAGSVLGVGAKGPDSPSIEDLQAGKGLGPEQFASQGVEGNTGTFGGGTLMATSMMASQVVSGLGQQVSADELLARSRGAIMNPNVELVFSGPVLRDFQFTWLLLARSKKEGDVIRKIIRALKVGIAPKHNNSALLINPDIWQLKYKGGGGELTTVNKFGQMGIKGMTVDYAPEGFWTAYEDSQPVACRLTLDFTEVRPIYEGDQLSTPENSVGY